MCGYACRPRGEVFGMFGNMAAIPSLPVKTSTMEHLPGLTVKEPCFWS